MIWLDHSDSWSKLLKHLLWSEAIKLKLAELEAIVDMSALDSHAAMETISLSLYYIL